MTDWYSEAREADGRTDDELAADIAMRLDDMTDHERATLAAILRRIATTGFHPADTKWIADHGLRIARELEAALRLDPEDPESVTMPLDLVDALHETAASINLDLVTHFDRDHTKAETHDAMLGIGLRLSKWAHAVWALAHHIEGGRNTPPTRYMRHMAAGAPPPSADDVVAAALRDLPAREWKASALPDPEVTK